MINRKRTVVVYGQGFCGSKGDVSVVRALLHEGYDVVWLVNASKRKMDLFEFEELLEAEGVLENLRTIQLEENDLYPYVKDKDNLIVEGSAPYAIIHMGLVFDEGLSKDDPIGHYCSNVQNTLHLVKLYWDLGMRKFIMNCQYDLGASESSHSFDSISESMMVSRALGSAEVRTITYSEIVGALPYDYIDTDGETKEELITFGNDDTSIINIISNLEEDKDGIHRIDLNEEIYKNRLGSATKSNAVRNYVFGADLDNLHIALLDRDFDSNIPDDLYIGVDATTKEVLDRMSSFGELEYKFTPENEIEEEYKCRIKHNIPEFLIKGENLTTDLNKLIVDNDKE